jgi:hypothetical protein
VNSTRNVEEPKDVDPTGSNGMSPSPKIGLLGGGAGKTIIVAIKFCYDRRKFAGYPRNIG